ncbi:MAG: hypothetical protein ACI38Y_02325 [Candidatus Methanomethylophilaceae archaeon]
MEFETRFDSKVPLDRLVECAVVVNVVNKNLNFGSMYVDDAGMIRFRHPYIFFDACPTIGVMATIGTVTSSWGIHADVPRARVNNFDKQPWATPIRKA